MTNEQKAYVRATIKDAIIGYKHWRLSYVEATLTIMNYLERGELDEQQTEYALRLLAQAGRHK